MKQATAFEPQTSSKFDRSRNFIDGLRSEGGEVARDWLGNGRMSAATRMTRRIGEQHRGKPFPRPRGSPGLAGSLSGPGLAALPRGKRLIECQREPHASLGKLLSNRCQRLILILRCQLGALMPSLVGNGRGQPVGDVPCHGEGFESPVHRLPAHPSGALGTELIDEVPGNLSEVTAKPWHQCRVPISMSTKCRRRSAIAQVAS